MTRVEHAHSHAHDHGGGLTERQRIEAQVYDERVRASMAAVTDSDLRVDPVAIPFPNREHEEFLSFALRRLGEVAGARVLEVGCGTGALSVHLALRGADVTGIDVSAENVALAERRALVNGVAGRAHFRAVPVEDVTDADGTYDAIIGNQVLHHFELEVAMPNIRRLLRPGGRALFCEPVLLLPDAVREMRDTPLVKRVLPKRVDTPTERSVSSGDVGIIRRTFPGVRLHPFHLLLRVQNFMELGDAAFDRLAAVDRAILRWVPPLRRLSRFVVFEVSA